MASLGNRDIRGEDQTNEVDEQRERARDEGVGGGGEEEMDELGGGREPDRRGREIDLEADGDSDHGKELLQAEELFGVDEEHLGDIVSKYAKIHQPVPFSSQTPKWRLNLEWHNVNYKVVIPLPPKSFIARMLLKLPIPASITNRFKKKREVPILNNVSGHVHAGQVVAIMGPTGSGKVRILVCRVCSCVCRVC
jgi:ABC-type multidrug transport system fused ATPase/permease subunit